MRKSGSVAAHSWLPLKLATRLITWHANSNVFPRPASMTHTIGTQSNASVPATHKNAKMKTLYGIQSHAIADVWELQS